MVIFGASNKAWELIKDNDTTGLAPAAGPRPRGQRWFLVPFAKLVVLATIGSSALIVRHSQHVAPDALSTVDSHPALTGPVATTASAVASAWRTSRTPGHRPTPASGARRRCRPVTWSRSTSTC